MLSLKNGKIILCGKVCKDPEKLFYTLLDLAEEGDAKLISEREIALGTV